jgi:nucleotide-binding universal stress UspA family protein
MRNILCATDLKPRSNVALERAAALAQKSGAKLIVLHVVRSGHSVQVARMQANRAYARLLSETERAVGPANSFKVLVRVGDVREVIATTAAEFDVDVVVVASPKSRRLESIVGTTAERLVRGTKRPVLIARHPVGDGYGDVTVAADLSDSTAPLIRKAVQIGGLERDWMTVVHAVHPAHDNILRSAGLDDSSIQEFQHGLVEDARERLIRMVVEAGRSLAATRITIRNQPAAAAIRNALEYGRPQLLVIGASRWFLMKRLLVGSVADGVLRSAACDVLVIPTREAVLNVEASNVLATARISGVLAASPRSVSVERGLHQQDRSDRRARAHE